MSYDGMPPSQGLYLREFEHDACGLGLYAHIKGISSHNIIEKGLEMLKNLDHRSGKNMDSGDGAGILTAIPDLFFRRECPFLLPPYRKYGVGMIFMDRGKTGEIMEELSRTIEAEGQTLLGWRTVPINQAILGEHARKTCPLIRQVFIGMNPEIQNEKDFQRKLFLIRKQLEAWSNNTNIYLYFASLSNRTLCYKGQLKAEEVGEFFLDLQREDYTSPFALVHCRYSTNTFSSWERAHPNRYLLHNGEINTIQGNIHWMKAREASLAREAFGEDAEKILPILSNGGSDSSLLDNAFEFFLLSGFDLSYTAMLLMPEAWYNSERNEEIKSLYHFNSLFMEPWDGPSAVLFTDGRQIGACLDRNGLRPIRYNVTQDDYIVLSSEAGALEIPDEKILMKRRLGPGEMLLVDLEEGRILRDEEIKGKQAKKFPYSRIVAETLVPVGKGIEDCEDFDNIKTYQKVFGYTFEEIHKYLLPLVREGKDPTGSMGYDHPIAVLSERPQLLFNYFKQLFAQVTNPPFDPIREKMVVSTVTYLGKEGNIFQPMKIESRRILLDTPVLNNGVLKAIREGNPIPLPAITIPILFSGSLEKAIEKICSEAEKAVRQGMEMIILSDKGMDGKEMPIPSLLATSSVHHHLIRTGLRPKASIIVESGEVREVHHFAVLIGYGADAINPYLAFATLNEAIACGHLAMTKKEAMEKYVKGVTDGIVKVMAKMGISSLQSYRGAQTFEALGISDAVIEKYFPGTVSQIGGIGLETIGEEVRIRHQRAFSTPDGPLDEGSDFQWRAKGEDHAVNPETIYLLQWAVRKGDYELYKQYSEKVGEKFRFLRDLFCFAKTSPIPINEVEPVESIVRRFKTGAMSYGSISQEAHETLAVAMNLIGGKSNSGEGGEDPNRYLPEENGTLRKSKVKQIASGRFGVDSHYLMNAEEIQIKMAQGAKPGEGGQLPAEKVYPWVAKVRGSTPGVGLISPPPNHDIYSIEDLAELIFDAKNANPDAKISVKLVAKSGVGTIAAGVAKAKADGIVISGYDGGTGASPKTSIKHAGLPWELGLAETHQTLLLNGLREKVILEVDGKLMTGKDVVIAAILGAEEFSFGTVPLVALGCIMMRVCHMDTCPVGIATQNPDLRAKFQGKPEHVIHLMTFIAREVREIMAELGVRSFPELIGRTDLLAIKKDVWNHWKAKYLQLDKLLYQPKPMGVKTGQNHQLENTLDMKKILPSVMPAINGKSVIQLHLPVKNTDRALGTITGSVVTKRWKQEGLPEDTIQIHGKGSAGQSLGAFLPKGITMTIEGEANDYLGKGLSGGKLIIKATKSVKKVAHEHVIVGNVALYGATAGEVYINGQAGERFAVRNSGAKAVVEGIGTHGCEYMTGGIVVVLGSIGKNFAAGMSGGKAYILPESPEEVFENINREMVDLERLEQEKDVKEVIELLENHVAFTGSVLGTRILNAWEEYRWNFVKVIPRDYKKITKLLENLKSQGYSEEEANRLAFTEVRDQFSKAFSVTH